MGRQGWNQKYNVYVCSGKQQAWIEMESLVNSFDFIFNSIDMLEPVHAMDFQLILADKLLLNFRNRAIMLATIPTKGTLTVRKK